VPTDYQGSSLLHPHNPMALFYTDYSLGFVGLRDQQWKFIYEMESGRSKLFDVWQDAGEGSDLARQNPERVRTYRQRLLTWSAAQKNLLIHSTGLASR
jgi:arylsulfatase A-like enzyme